MLNLNEWTFFSRCFIIVSVFCWIAKKASETFENVYGLSINQDIPLETSLFSFQEHIHSNLN